MLSKISSICCVGGEELVVVIIEAYWTNSDFICQDNLVDGFYVSFFYRYFLYSFWSYSDVYVLNISLFFGGMLAIRIWSSFVFAYPKDS